MEITKREGTGESEREREQGLGEQNLLKCSVVKQKQPPPLPKDVAEMTSLCTDDRKRWDEVAFLGVAIRKIMETCHSFYTGLRAFCFSFWRGSFLPLRELIAFDKGRLIST